MILTHHPLLQRFGEFEDIFHLVAHHLAQRDAGPARNHLGDDRTVNKRMDQGILALNRLQLAEKAGQLSAIFGGIGRRGGRLDGSRGGAILRCRGGLFLQGGPDGIHLGGQGLFLLPLGGQIGAASEFLAQALLDFGQLGLVAHAQILLALQRLFCQTQLVHLAPGIFQLGRSGRLAEGHAGTGGVEQADALVGQLTIGNVTLRETHGLNDRIVEDAHLVMLLKSTDHATNHRHGLVAVGLLDLDELKTPFQGGVILE